MFVYQQSTGRLEQNGRVLTIGYSGHGDGVNCPAKQSVSKVGPLPQGYYTIGRPETHPKLGPLAMPLTPADGDEEYGRSAFFLHGDNSACDHSASEGCIILDHATRELVAAAVDRRLQVIA